MLTAKEIDAVLPQTQCEQCGFKGCFKYAEAIAGGEAPINRCPPGGQAGIELLAALTHRPVIPLEPECGEHVPFEVADIDRKRCIGCRLCINACPTEAVIGAAKHMHVVDIERCTGCCLCAIACPMDCIQMIRVPMEWTRDKANSARDQFRARNARIRLQKEQQVQRLEAQSSQSAKKAFLASLLKKSKEP